MVVEPLKFHHNGVMSGSYWVISTLFEKKIVFYTGNLLNKSEDFSDIADISLDEDITYAMKFSRRDFKHALHVASLLPSFGYFNWHVHKLNIYYDEEFNKR